MPLLVPSDELRSSVGIFVIDELGSAIWEEIIIALPWNPTESHLGACDVCVCVCVRERGLPTRADVCPRLTPAETDNNGTARRVRPRQTHSRLSCWGPRGGWFGGWGGIFLLCACQTKVREHIRGARLWSAEVGSLFKQEMGWKTSGFSIFVARWTRFCAFVNDGAIGGGRHNCENENGRNGKISVSFFSSLSLSVLMYNWAFFSSPRPPKCECSAGSHSGGKNTNSVMKPFCVGCFKFWQMYMLETKIMSRGKVKVCYKMKETKEIFFIVQFEQ